MSIFLPFVIMLALLIVGAFFAAAEAGFLASSEEKVHQIELEGNRLAKLLKRLLSRKQKLISVAVLGSNLVHTSSASIATVLMTNLLGDSGVSQGITVVIVTIVTSVTLFLFGEMIPKSVGMHSPEKTALFAAPIFRFLMKVLSPIVVATDAVIAFVFRVFGVNNNSIAVSSAYQELKIAVDMKHRQGRFVKNDRDMLDGLLNLGEVEVREIMCHRGDLFAIDINLSKDLMLKQILLSSHSRIPFYNGKLDDIIGVLHIKDFFLELQKAENQHEKIDIAALLSRPIFVPENVTLKKQLSQFKAMRHHLAFVVDEYGGIMGIVTLEDIIEEIVGDISDEHDKEESGLVVCEDGIVLIDGDYPVRDFNRKFDTDLAFADVSTMGGLIVESLQRIPKTGENFQLFGYEILIKDTQATKIGKIQMKKMPISDEDFDN
jgi:Mg2+/Co2+ transporter CorB